MALINKNIWLAFYLVGLIWTLFLGISSFNTYKNVYNEFVSEQLSLTMMSKNSLNATFKQYEVLLNIVAGQVLKEDQVAATEDIKSIMKSATDLDSSVSAFALVNLDGSIHASEPVSPILKGASLTTIVASQDTFVGTVKTDGMLIGRTYFSESLDSIIIPFRLTVRDSKGDARFVLSIAVSLDKGFDFFVNNADNSGLQNTYLYRETDRYFQLAPIEKIYDANIYQYQISQADIDESIKRLEGQIEIPFAELKDKEIVFSNENIHPARQSLNASVYMKDYSLWLVTEIKLSAIKHAFLEKVAILFLAYLLSIVLIFLLFRNIAASDKKKATELEFQANHDYLTHLCNRYYFDRYLASVDNKTVFSLIYLNIDHFKAVNDSYGHVVGDLLLTKVANRISAIANKGDLVIRFSGDEFILISFDKSELQTVAICDKLLSCFDAPLLSKDSEIMLSASIGVSFYPKDSSKPEDIKRNADLAMYSAKQQRNTAVLFNQSLLNDYLYVRKVEHELKKSLVNDELYMVYQPQFAEDGCIVGVEALLRWQNETLGYMPPDKFISIAESMGMMDTIGTFVIERTLTEMMALQEKMGLKYDVSINVSVKQFKNPDFFDQLMAIIHQLDFPTKLLILEITESVLIDDVDVMRNLMIKIKQHNIRISLDDFGTGYSSLSILKSLPIDELKIDKSFVDDVISDDETRSMINSIISIAKNKQIKTVAEGVETQDMLFALKELGCDIYQGYYFSKPIDKNKLELLLIDNKICCDTGNRAI